MILTLTLNPALDGLIFLEQFQLHGKNIAREKRLFASGKGFNVAKALAALDLPVTAVGFVGAHDIPMYEQVLGARGIRLAMTPIAATRTNLKLIERDNGFETEVNEPGAEVTDAELTHLHNALQTLFKQGAEWLVLSGSIAPGLAPDLYAEIIRKATAAGVNTLLDSSGEFLRRGITANPTILKINRAELAEVTTLQDDSADGIATAASSLLTDRTQLVVVSLGRRGACLAHKSGRWLAEPPRVQVVNAIGAGDVMSAGVVDAWQRGLELPALLNWSTALASASVLTLESGDVDPRVARELAARITLYPL